MMLYGVGKVESTRKALMVGDELQIGTTTLRAMATVVSNGRKTSAAGAAEAASAGEVVGAAA